MRRSAHVSAVVLALVLAVLAAGGGAGEATTFGGPPLQPFGSCPALLAYAKQHALPLVGAYGLGGAAIGVALRSRRRRAGASRDASTPVPGVDYSTTNVQEEGVDEPDLVKSNGSTLFVVRADRLFAVDVRAGKPRLRGSLQLSPGASYELLLARQPPARALARRRLPGRRHRRHPSSDRARPAAVDPDRGGRRAIPVRCGSCAASSFDAEILSARLVGSVARVVTSSSHAADPAVHAARAGDTGRDGRRRRPQPRRRARVEDRRLAPPLPDQGPPRRDARPAHARRLPRRPPSPRSTRVSGS